MSQVIKIKRGGISGISGASTVKGELIIATGSLGNNASGPFLLAHGDSLGLVAGAVFTGSSVPTITDSELNGILFYDDTNNKFIRLDSAGNQSLDIAATGFTGDTDDVAEGSTNLYFTNARADARIAAASVTDLTDVSSAGSGIIITAGERTQLTTAAAFTASLDADLATFSVPASTTISAFGKTLVDDADAAAARTTLGVDAAGTDNSTNVTLAGSLDYITISGQEITRNAINISTDLNVTPTATGLAVFTGSNAAAIRTTLGLGSLSTLNSIDISANTNLAASTGITLTDDTLTTNDGEIVHDNLSGFVANEHIDHSAVSITAGDGLTGGGTIAATRTIVVGAGTGVTVNANDIAIGQDVATTADVTFASASVSNLTVTNNASIQGTLTTVNSNDVNIGDRIITLNTADGAGDAGVHVHDTTGAQTGSIMWDASGNYWKGGLKDAEKRIVTFTADNPTDNAFIHTNGSDEIVAIAAVAGGILQRNADNNAFTVSNTIDGGSY